MEYEPRLDRFTYRNPTRGERRFPYLHRCHFCRQPITKDDDFVVGEYWGGWEGEEHHKYYWCHRGHARADMELQRALIHSREIYEGDLNKYILGD